MSTVESRGPSKLGGPQAWLVWCIAVTFVVYYFSFQTGYAIANSSVQKDIGLSVAQVGLIAAIYTWVFALCQFMSGPLLDRLGARKVLLPAILLVTLGIFAFANAKNFEMLLLSQALIAIGACTGFVGAGYVGGKWFGMAKFSFMFGLVQFAASLFSAFNQNLLNWALSVFQWHELFNYEGGFGIVLLIVAVMYLRDPAPVAVPPGRLLARFWPASVSHCSMSRACHISGWLRRLEHSASALCSGSVSCGVRSC